ncbi:putative amidoligase enzyme-domain-containing protein [Lasiosphaeria hispida]|uniref:Amidoligase enzyme-domain-containing protein n=1 Tax=Lasiosphaeria hispida TaxID=260671 RepID=A0AAJ0HE37_9PEZI|nr:putative amidoligase enzyme-domain-containing protein [Lasiosphaeria hispida]
MALSLGLEIEAVAVRMLESPTALPLGQNDQLSLITTIIERAGLPARVYAPSTTRCSGPNYCIWNAPRVTVMEATSDSDTSESAFQERFGFELVSPAFPIGSASTGVDWADNLRRCIAIGAEILWKSNRSTGFHIHVGRGISRSDNFTLEEVKKVAMLYCRFEATIDRFHPAHRRHDNDNIESVRNNVLIRDSSLAHVYSMIQEADTIKRVNFTSLEKHGTIEFRQHEGTIDAEIIITWARFVLKFVEVEQATAVSVSSFSSSCGMSAGLWGRTSSEYHS